MGQRDGFSLYDIAKINALYQCDPKSGGNSIGPRPGSPITGGQLKPTRGPVQPQKLGYPGAFGPLPSGPYPSGPYPGPISGFSGPGGPPGYGFSGPSGPGPFPGPSGFYPSGPYPYPPPYPGPSGPFPFDTEHHD